MTDYNQSLSPGDINAGWINVVIETPTGSMEKIEWDLDKSKFRLDRELPLKFAMPMNYGFIPKTLNEDGDELDVMVFSSNSIPTGIKLKAEIIGVMKFIDEGKVDDKIISIPISKKYNTTIKTVADIPKKTIDSIIFHFTHYKDQINTGSTRVVGWGEIDVAKQIIYKSIKSWNNQ